MQAVITAATVLAHPSQAATGGAKSSIRSHRAGSPGLWPLLTAIFDARNRGLRVGLLLASVAAMAGADLWMTLTYVTSIGMMELNPLARAVMLHGSPWLLAAWKISTSGFGVVALFCTRRSGYAEIAAWLCFAVMSLLTAHWISFNGQITNYAEELTALAGTNSECWVEMR